MDVTVKEFPISEPQVNSRVYFLIDAGEIVYIGQSNVLGGRIVQHQQDKKFDRVLYIDCDASIVLEVERALILSLRPKYNSEWTRWRADRPVNQRQIERLQTRKRLEEVATWDLGLIDAESSISDLLLPSSVVSRFSDAGFNKICHLSGAGIVEIINLLDVGYAPLHLVKDFLYTIGVAPLVRVTLSESVNQ